VQGEGRPSPCEGHPSCGCIFKNSRNFSGEIFWLVRVGDWARANSHQRFSLRLGGPGRPKWAPVAGGRAPLFDHRALAPLHARASRVMHASAGAARAHARIVFARDSRAPNSGEAALRATGGQKWGPRSNCARYWKIDLPRPVFRPVGVNDRHVAARCGFHSKAGLYLRPQWRKIMKLALIALGLLATTGVVYAACLFC
jgi:hypothetical protein